MQSDLSRRQFLKLAGMAAPASLALAACSGETRRATGPVYFSKEEMAFVRAATGRLIPTDELGPGAADAGVPEFIDVQLAGPYGQAERWYMRGPWADGVSEQGFQSRYTPAQIYRRAIAAIDEHCRKQYGAPFARMKADDQDQLLRQLGDKSLELEGADAATFFKLLWQNTQEGYLADPAYGGNRDFAGWKLIGFPGPRYNYVEQITQYGKPYARPFVSLVGRHPASAAGRVEGAL